MSSKLQILFNGDETGFLDSDSGESFSFGTGSDKDVCVSAPDAKIAISLSFVSGRWWIADDSSQPPATLLGRRFDQIPVNKPLSISIGKDSLELRPKDEGAAKSQLDVLKVEIYDSVVSSMKTEAAVVKNITDDELSDRVESLTAHLMGQRMAASSLQHDKAVLDEIRTEIVQDILHLGPLEPLIADDSITEIMVISFDTIYVEQKGRISLSKRTFRNPEHLLTVIERIVSPIGRRIDESSPLVDARLHDGSRVNAVIPPITPDGACLTIRKFGKAVFTVDKLVSVGSMTPGMGKFLDACVRARKNIVVSGGTGSGKTSLLNALSNYLPADERIITIEDSLELKLQQKHVVRMEARPPNAEDKGEVSIRTLVKNSLRMRPDRIVIGECRGGEALDMLQAMNTGHDGSLTTVHANSPKDTISRLETLVLMAGMDLPLTAIRNQICSAINIIVQTARFSDGTRKISSISEITGIDERGEPVLNEIFTFKQKSVDKNSGKVIGQHSVVGKPSFIEEFAQRGIEFTEDSLGI